MTRTSRRRIPSASYAMTGAPGPAIRDADAAIPHMVTDLPAPYRLPYSLELIPGAWMVAADLNEVP